MKKLDFGNGNKFSLGGENTGSGILYHMIQIDRKDFSNVMKNVLSSDQINFVLEKCEYQDVLTLSNKILERFKYGFFNKSYWEMYGNNEAEAIKGIKKSMKKFSKYRHESSEINKAYELTYLVYTNQIIYKRPVRNRQSIKGHIYLLECENQLFKIGRTTNIRKRMSPFSVNFPMKWYLKYSFQSNDYELAEGKLHDLFKEKRKSGEWFALSDEDVRYIMSIQDFEF